MKSSYFINGVLDWGRLEKIFIACFLLFCFFFLCFRNLAGQYPGLLDEYFYNSFSRLTSFDQAWIPNYLFYFIYRATNACGNGFLSCVYLLNVCFYLAAFFPIYAVSKKMMSSPLAFFVSALIICSPVNYWTGYFMPESAYFLFFWLLIWGFFNLDISSKARDYFFLGSILGLASLIKVHALFLAPPLICFIYITNKFNGGPLDKAALRRISLFLLAVISVKYGLSWVMTGKVGFSIFGGYSSVLSTASAIVSGAGTSPINSAALDSPFSPINILKREAIHSFALNVMPLFLFFSVPIAIGVQAFAGNLKAASTRFCLLALLVIACLVLIIQVFQWTMLAIGQGQVELYWRYYEFALTLLFVLPAIFLNSKNIYALSAKHHRQFIGAIIFFFIVIAVINNHGSFWVSPRISKMIFYCFSIASMMALVIWIFKPILGTRLYLFIFLPLFLIVSNFAMYKHLNSTRMTPNSSSIGAFIESQLTTDDLKKVLVVQDTQLTQTVPLIFLKSPNLKFQTIAVNDIAYDLKNVPADRDWIILMGNHILTGDALNQTHMQYQSFGEITLFGGHGSLDINFQNNEWPGVIQEQKGLFNPPEPWGAWSIDEKVVLRFIKPLPRKFDLKLTARAFGPNANRDIVLRIGDQTSKFQLPATFPSFETKSIRIDNPNRLNEISIDIPRPIAPKELGLGDDDRQIGVGFSSLSIKW